MKFISEPSAPSAPTGEVMGVAEEWALSKPQPPLKLQRILVPLDFSRDAMQALGLASYLAQKFHAAVHLVHVRSVDEPGGLSEAGNVMRECAETFSFLQSRISSAPALTPEACHVRTGPPYQEICDLARELDADLIVLATRGHAGLKRVVLGSTAERVVRFASCPVLVARGRKREADTESAAVSTQEAVVLRKVLVPVDFSRCGTRGAVYAARLAKAFDASLCLLHAVPPPPPPIGDRILSNLPTRDEAVLANARTETEAYAKLAFLSDVKCDVEVHTGYPVDEICAAASRPGVDLIVISSHGHTGINRMMLGSVAEHVVRYAECPVLVVPSHHPSP